MLEGIPQQTITHKAVFTLSYMYGDGLQCTPYMFAVYFHCRTYVSRRTCFNRVELWLNSVSNFLFIARR